MFFEYSKLIEAGNLENYPEGDGVIGIRLKTRGDRIITLRGLTKDECKTVAEFFGEILTLDIRVA